MSSLTDVYRDAFLLMMKEGKTPLEALRQFDESKWREALVAELYEPSTWHINPSTLKVETRDGLPTLLELSGMAGREEMNERDMGQAITLWLAGWTSETPHKSQQDVMSWYWRAPSKRHGKPGRRYLSTNQAFNALKKAQSRP